tara:strand:- start:14 stop:505 length:492 start_codon:yes stop_codon:yes gene_type:complete
MEALKKLSRNFINLNVDNLMFKTMSDNPLLKKLVRRLNTVKQLRTEHVDSDNKPLYSKRHQSGVYSATTEYLSGGRKKAGTPYTLFDTGEFFNSFEVMYEGDGILIDADPIKKNSSGAIDTNLFEEYGEKILGLNDVNLRIFIDALMPKIRETIIKQAFAGVF